MSQANLEALRAAITGDFQNRFKTGEPPAAPFPVRYENQPFQQPRAATWGAFSMVTGSRDFSALGGKEFRTLGIAFLQVFQVEEQGTKAAFIAGDLVASFWDGVTIAAGPGGTVLFRATNVKRVGRTPDGWYQFNVEVPFQFDTQEVAQQEALDFGGGTVLDFGGGITVT